MPKVVEVPTYTLEIAIAGDFHKAIDTCRAYCDGVGLCVTVTKTEYVYTGGMETGVKIGLINYPRFPKNPYDLWAEAMTLAEKLRVELGQESYSIIAPDQTRWVSHRVADNT